MLRFHLVGQPPDIAPAAAAALRRSPKQIARDKESSPIVKSLSSHLDGVRPAAGKPASLLR